MDNLPENYVNWERNNSKEALLNYREMPNLQWFCDSCIIQTRSPNVSFPALNKFNYTAVVRTSSPSYIQHSFPAANRNRKPNLSAKLIKSSVFLETRSPRINRDIEKVNDLNSLTPKKEIRPVNQFEDSPDENGSHPLTTSAINQSDVAQPVSKHTIADCKDITETLGLEIPSATSSSFAEVVTLSSTAENVSAKVKSSPIQPRKNSIQLRSITSPFETQKVAYVSNFHPSVTEEEVVDYLLRKNVISSSEDVVQEIGVQCGEELG